MMRRIIDLFRIKTRFEACLVIYSLALGAAERGRVYLEQYPGAGGKLLFGACALGVLMAGGKIMDGVRYAARRR